MKTKRLRTLLTGLMLLMTTILIAPCSPARATGPQVTAGNVNTVGLQSDGTVVAVGSNFSGQLNVSSWTNITAVAAGYLFTVGLKSDGTVVGVGTNGNGSGQLNVSSWTNIVAVEAGYYHTVGLKSDGTVAAVGDNSVGQLNVSSWTNIVAVAAGDLHTVGLQSDGTVVAVGDNYYGQTEVTGTAWANITAVAAGSAHTVGLKSDGTVVAVGWNDSGQLNVSSWTNIVAVAAGYVHTVGLKSDGTVVGAGDKGSGQLDVSSWTNIVAVAAGSFHTVGLKSDGTVVTVGNNGQGQANVSSWHLQVLGTIMGTVGTQVIVDGSGFGSKRGTVSVGTAAAKVVAWFNTRIIFQMPVSLAPGQYPIYITPVGQATITYDKPFVIKAPELQLVQADTGYAGDLIVLKGKYFGSKKGTIALGTKSCPASYWYMDPVTGESMAAFRVPAKLTAGPYSITLTNGAGSSKLPTTAFTVVSGKSTQAESLPGQED